jgi:FkbM family methyltransferase
MRLSNCIPLMKPLYRFCKEYSDRFTGENNGAIETNGELHYLKQCIQNCSVVFDVGANRGEWTNLARTLNPSISVHCFEPIKEMFSLLIKNPFPSTVTCNNRGLSSESGSKDIYLGVQSLYARTGLNAGWQISSPGEPEKIDLTTLDEYCMEKNIKKIDLLKCDVEGHEYNVFLGGKKMLSEGKIDRIQFEYGGCCIDARVLLKDIFELLTGFNFLIYKIMPKGLLRIPEYDQRLENFAYKNFAAIRKSVQRNNV